MIKVLLIYVFCVGIIAGVVMGILMQAKADMVQIKITAPVEETGDCG